MTTFERYQCWRQARVGEVINKEAVAVDVVDFMATHAPLGQIVDVRRGGLPLSEIQVLDDLVRASAEDRHVFAVIQGIPGTGKSHLIRWLYERSRTDNRGRDVVLLIERAQNSLLGTLRQIIDRLEIESDALRQQIDKLRGAVASLSERALADSVLDHLRVATYEREQTFRVHGRIRRWIERFLLDPVVRDFLKRPEGPIERIVRFLTTGRPAADQAGGRPEFAPDDFDLHAGILREVKAKGYPEARDLAEALALKPDLRTELAAYLNRLLDYAISRTIVLSGDDLKQTFNDLRRALRQRGQGLTLLIEDITAFTGIDLGLIDVLITQHTGEGNRDLCRIASVIGITDGYFRDRFPDNVHDRVTHHLSLNSGLPDRPEASLLHSPRAAADLAARYLNAMRADRQSFRTWLDDGSQQGRLPNACDECPVRQPCHSAFGAVNIGSADGDGIEVGLYPFNQRAIWDLYKRLNQTTISHTPRSLLHYVLLDVLQSHGPKVKVGLFPPPPKELAAGVRDIPALTKPVQQRVLNEQGGPEVQRLQSLVLFWGDGTLDARGEGAARTVGGLSEAVFRVFGLRAIAGVASPDAPGAEAVQAEEFRATPYAEQKHQPEILIPIQPDPEVQPPELPHQPKPVARQGTRYDALIAKWRLGEQLERYEDLRRLLINFIKNAIDWDLHGISPGVVEEQLSGFKVAIEGQTGQALGDRLVFERSDDLADVLQALAELQENSSQIAPDALGAHLHSLTVWLHRHEAEIVNHTRQPTRQQPVPMRLVEMLLLDALLIEWLSDNLRIGTMTPVDLLRLVLKGAGPEYADRPPSDQDWLSQIDRARSAHGNAWSSLMQALRPAQVRAVRTHLLKQLNLPQGTSSDIRFIDAATALDVIAHLLQRDWALRPIAEIGQRALTVWQDAGTVYRLFADRLHDVLEDERIFQKDLLARLRVLTGNAEPDDVFKSIDTLLRIFQERAIPHNLAAPPSKAQAMRTALQYLDTSVAEQGRAALAARLSAGTQHVKTSSTLEAYFTSLIKLVQQVEEQQRRIVEQLQADGDAQRLEQQVLQLYDEAARLLRSPLPVEQAQEVQP